MTRVVHEYVPSGKGLVIYDGPVLVAVLALWNRADATEVIEYMQLVMQERAELTGEPLPQLRCYDMTYLHVSGVGERLPPIEPRPAMDMLIVRVPRAEDNAPASTEGDKTT